MGKREDAGCADNRDNATGGYRQSPSQQKPLEPIHNPRDPAQTYSDLCRYSDYLARQLQGAQGFALPTGASALRRWVVPALLALIGFWAVCAGLAPALPVNWDIAQLSWHTILGSLMLMSFGIWLLLVAFRRMAKGDLSDGTAAVREDAPSA